MFIGEFAFALLHDCVSDRNEDMILETKGDISNEAAQQLTAAFSSLQAAATLGGAPPDGAAESQSVPTTPHNGKGKGSRKGGRGDAAPKQSARSKSQVDEGVVEPAKVEKELTKKILDCENMLLQLCGCSYGVSEPWPHVLQVWLVGCCFESFSLAFVKKCSHV